MIVIRLLEFNVNHILHSVQCEREPGKNHRYIKFILHTGSIEYTSLLVGVEITNRCGHTYCMFFCEVFCRSLFVLLSFFLSWPLHWLSFRFTASDCSLSYLVSCLEYYFWPYDQPYYICLLKIINQIQDTISIS